MTSSCHPFAYLREYLSGQGILSAHEATLLPSGTSVAVAGLNVRPHRPPAKAGGRHLFTTLEDESAYLQVSFFGDAAGECVSTVLLSPVFILKGTIRHRGAGSYLLAQSASPLSLPKAAQAAQSESVGQRRDACRARGRLGRESASRCDADPMSRSDMVGLPIMSVARRVSHVMYNSIMSRKQTASTITLPENHDELSLIAYCVRPEAIMM